jgi:hypothetical protein
VKEACRRLMVDHGCTVADCRAVFPAVGRWTIYHWSSEGRWGVALRRRQEWRSVA